MMLFLASAGLGMIVWGIATRRHLFVLGGTSVQCLTAVLVMMGAG